MMDISLNSKYGMFVSIKKLGRFHGKWSSWLINVMLQMYSYLNSYTQLEGKDKSSWIELNYLDH